MGSLLDARALQEYSQAIKDLQEVIDEAERNNDPEAAANALKEKQTIESMISGAFGLGGSARPVGSPAEAARKSVSKAIHRAIEKIKEENLHLGEHLSNSIGTGTYLKYSPGSAVDWHF